MEVSTSAKAAELVELPRLATPSTRSADFETAGTELDFGSARRATAVVWQPDATSVHASKVQSVTRRIVKTSLSASEPNSKRGDIHVTDPLFRLTRPKVSSLTVSPDQTRKHFVPIKPVRQTRPRVRRDPVATSLTVSDKQSRTGRSAHPPMARSSFRHGRGPFEVGAPYFETGNSPSHPATRFTRPNAR